MHNPQHNTAPLSAEERAAFRSYMEGLDKWAHDSLLEEGALEDHDAATCPFCSKPEGTS